MQRSFMKFWQILLLPLSFLFALIVITRRFLYHIGVKKIIHNKVPVIVVGNIMVGGSGKTPLTIALAKHLNHQNFCVGIVSGGYGGTHKNGNLIVTPDTLVSLAGDEPVLLAKQTQAIIVVNKDRVSAVKKAVDLGANVIISDDGLQHYRMGRKIEIALIDSTRGVGNSFLLPSGLLREPVSRLKSVDFIVHHHRMGKQATYPHCLQNKLKQSNVYSMNLVPTTLVNALTSKQITISDLLKQAKKVHTVAGIALPDSFFAQLKALGFEVIEHRFSDHYVFSKTDFETMTDYPILMTQKDWVKCVDFANNDMWYLSVDAQLEEAFLTQITKKIHQR